MGRNKQSYFLWMAGFGLLLAGLLVGQSVGTADAQEVNVSIGDSSNQISNWDYRSRRRLQKDWPVHIIFWNNATVNKVKGTDGSHLLDEHVFKTVGGSKYLWTREAGVGSWDSDGGRKEANCKPFNRPGMVLHYRVYANDDDRLWAPGWGYYVPMTTHYDYDDPTIWGTCDNRMHGWDEQAADWILWHYRDNSSGPRWSAVDDFAYFYNPSSGIEMVGGIAHHRTSDGYVSVVRVP